MILVADTNIVVRAVTLDPPLEGQRAVALLSSNQIVVPTVAFCEMVWVLRRLYKCDKAEIVSALNVIIGIDRLMFDRTAVEAGIAMMEAGGDFADGVIALEGRRLGGDVFATFDRKAAALLKRAGHDSILVSAD